MSSRSDSNPVTVAVPTRPALWSLPRVIVAFAILCLIWGLNFVVLHVGLTSAPPFTYSAFRAFAGGLTLVGYLLATGSSFPRSRAFHLTAAFLGLTYVAFFWTGLTLATKLITPGEVAILTYTQPMLVAIGARLFLGERFSPIKVLGLVLGFAGVVVVLAGQGSLTLGSSVVGYFWAIMGAIGWTVGTVIFKARAGQQTVLWTVALQLIYGAIPLTGLALVLEQPWVDHLPTFLWTIAFTGVAAAALANLLWYSLLRQRSASQVASFVFLVPIVAVGADAFLLADRFGPGVILGCLLTVAGIWLVNRK